jgi:hypothetical protein
MKPLILLMLIFFTSCGQCRTSKIQVVAVTQAHEKDYTGKCTGSDYGISWSNGEEGCWPPELVNGPTEYTRVGDTKEMCTE